MNVVQSQLHALTHASIYLGVLSLHVQNFVREVNCMPTLQQVCSVILLQIIHQQLHVKLSFCSQKSTVTQLHCCIVQKLFSFKFELFSLIVMQISVCHTGELFQLLFIPFLSNIKRFVLQFPFCINNQQLDNVFFFLQKIHKRYTSVAFTCFCLLSFGRSQ